MGWTHTTERRAGKRRAPGIESLETRQLLSTVDASSPVAVLGSPVPAGFPGGSTTGTDYQTITGAAATRAAYGVDGAGQTVALIDTGVNYNHEALGGGYGPGKKVVGGWDFAQNDANPAATWQHGTAVAGLIASTDPAHLGIAPGVDLVALRVFGDDNRGDFNRVADALQWVVDNHGRYNITVVNISLSDGNNYTLNWFANDGGVGQRITSLIHQLDQINIPVVTATGNSFAGQQGQGFTSIVADSISVSASDASDHVVGNAQRLGKSLGGVNATDVLAPGAGMVAPVDGDNFASGDGTSFAAPIVTGGIVLLQQIYKARFGSLPTVAQIDSWLESGGASIQDGATGSTFSRIDVKRSADLIPAAPAPLPQAAPPAPAPAPLPTPTPTPAPPAVPPVATTPSTSTIADAPAASATPDPTPVPVPSTPSTDLVVDDSAAKAKNDKPAQQFAALFRALFGGSVKSVSVWGTKSAAQNVFVKAGMTNIVAVKTWTASTAGAAHPTGKLAVKHSSLGAKRRGR